MDNKKDVLNNNDINDFDTIFATEEDVFDIEVKFYNKDDKVFVFGVDEDFDNSEANIKKLIITIKYPNQKDCLNIINKIKNNLSEGVSIYFYN